MYPARLPPFEYPGHYVVRRVTNAGTFRFQSRVLFLANALKQHHIGLEESDAGVLLTRLDERDHIMHG